MQKKAIDWRNNSPNWEIYGKKATAEIELRQKTSELKWQKCLAFQISQILFEVDVEIRKFIESFDLFRYRLLQGDKHDFAFI